MAKAKRVIRENDKKPQPLRVERAVGNASNGLDKVIHERMRLGIISALAGRDRLSFNELKGVLEASDGNISAHARKLEDAGYIACSKSFAGRMPLTEYSITTAGRRALERYLDHMEALIKAMKGM